MKTYTELMTLPTFEERFLYLQEGIVHGVGDSTFGSLRCNNQALYRGPLWRIARAKAIARDGACDLAVPDRVIPTASMIRVHHINPLTIEMFDEGDPLLYHPDNLITMLFSTHQLLSYGGPPPAKETWVERRPYDHLPWKRKD